MQVENEQMMENQEMQELNEEQDTAVVEENTDPKPEEKKVTPGKMALVIGAIVVVIAVIVGLLASGTVGRAVFCLAPDGGDTHQVHQICHDLLAVVFQPGADLAVICFVDHKEPPESGGVGLMIEQGEGICYYFLEDQ